LKDDSVDNFLMGGEQRSEDIEQKKRKSDEDCPGP